MPPTFPYLLAFMLWLGLACLVWLAAIFMAIFVPTRPFAWRMSLAMAGTFPGVWAFQIAAAPSALGILSLAWAVWRFLEPSLPETTENPLVIGPFIAAVMIDFALILVMSLIGFYEGWRTGWLYANGHPWREVIKSGPTARLIASVRKRLKGRRSVGGFTC